MARDLTVGDAMIRSVRPIATFAAFALAMLAQPAAADGRRFVISPAQKIDLVRDLPNDATFERDGQYFDLGYIYPIHTVNGASVASAGGDAGFVLYYDDRFIRLGPSELETLTYALGEDPTAGYVPPVPANAAPSSDPWGRRPPVDGGVSGPVRSSATSAGFGVGAAFAWFFFLIVGAIMVGVRILRGMARGAAQLHRERVSAAGGDGAFEARVAARLADLHSGGPATRDMPPSTPRAFGRKLV